MRKRYLVVLFVALIILGTIYITVKSTGQNQLTGALTLEQLKSLPYLTYTKENVDENQSGVTIYNPELAFDGYNLYKGNLMDMGGNIVHPFKGDLVFILDSGDILARREDKFGRYDWNSNVIWEKNIMTHHELTESPSGNILVASKEVHRYNNRDVEFDVIIEFSPEGDELYRWSTYEQLDHIKKFHSPSKLDIPAIFYKSDCNRSEFGGCYEYYHLNSIQVLPETELGQKDKRFQKGNWLISLPYFNLVVILDKDTKEIVWSWGPGELSVQHTPRMLDNGNILVYDNGKHVRTYSRVIELDPVNKEIVWEYKANPPESFYSATCGSAQRLPNGNTLIAESEDGRAFEVTKSGEIVWEWLNPNINEEGKRGIVYRMIRIPKDKIDKLLAENKT